MLAILNLSRNLSPELQSPVSNWWLNISVDNDNLEVRHHLQLTTIPSQPTSLLILYVFIVLTAQTKFLSSS